MLNKTNKFRVDTPNPWMEKGKIVTSTNKVECGDYPHIFSPLYRYKDTDVLLAVGDTVFRIVHKNWEDKVKAVQITEYHLDSDVEIFVSLDDAENELERRKKEKQKLYNQHDVYSALESIFLYTSQPIKDMSFEDIEKRFNHINTHAREALTILKSK